MTSYSRAGMYLACHIQHGAARLLPWPAGCMPLFGQSRVALSCICVVGCRWCCSCVLAHAALLTNTPSLWRDVSASATGFGVEIGGMYDTNGLRVCSVESLYECGDIFDDHGGRFP